MVFEGALGHLGAGGGGRRWAVPRRQVDSVEMAPNFRLPQSAELSITQCRPMSACCAASASRIEEETTRPEANQ